MRHWLCSTCRCYKVINHVMVVMVEREIQCRGRGLTQSLDGYGVSTSWALQPLYLTQCTSDTLPTERFVPLQRDNIPHTCYSKTSTSRLSRGFIQEGKKTEWKSNQFQSLSSHTTWLQIISLVQTSCESATPPDCSEGGSEPKICPSILECGVSFTAAPLPHSASGFTHKLYHIAKFWAPVTILI